MSSDNLESKATLVENMETNGDSSPAGKDGKIQRPVGIKISNAAEMSEPLTIPAPLRRRVQALRKLQLQTSDVEAEFYRRFHELECEFADRMAPFHENRKKIVTGEHEPTDEECDIALEFDEAPLAEELSTQETIKNDENERKFVDYYKKGVAEFWLTALRNSGNDMLFIEYPNDDLILKHHLLDIEVKYSKDPMKFTFYFHFSPNEYFTNAILTKEYVLKSEIDPKDPFSFDGVEVVEVKGCTIDWKEGKNVTKRDVTRMQTNKKTGKTRVVKRVEKINSFFDFFDTPVKPAENADEGKQLLYEAELGMHTELASFFRHTFIPHATLYYTRELCDDDDTYEDEEEDDEDDEMDDDDMDDGEEDENDDQSSSDDEKKVTKKTSAKDKGRK